MKKNNFTISFYNLENLFDTKMTSMLMMTTFYHKPKKIGMRIDIGEN